MLSLIAKELKNHMPFTTVGAITGIVLLLLLRTVPYEVSYKIFYIFHPLHVLMSALVTTSLLIIYKSDNNYKPTFLNVFIIGYIGSVGIATISDSIVPYLGEWLLDLPNRGIHLGFIEKWWLVNPLAILGIIIAYFKAITKIPHFLHVLISTWASLFHILMAGGSVDIFTSIVVFIFLFLAVWLPCCTSDIVFPLLFVGDKHVHNHN
ncbi:MAG: hypothetical protein SVN78_00175 [Deferribacterota bacterium]|nr:hypothetical protein [Deferribacterota bacterium]